MICPNCNVAKLEVRQDNYYCPKCKIYIGSVNTPIQTLSAQTATSGWQLQNQIQQNSSDKPITDQPEIKGPDIKKYLIPIFILIFLIIGNLFINNYSNYISFSPYCNIKIETQNEGFKDSLIKTLDSFKMQDRPQYQNICGYISKIVERLCPISDEGTSGTANTKFEDHCYVKGSRTIYLNNLEDFISTAELSGIFWAN